MSVELEKSETVYASHGARSENQAGLPGKFIREIKVTIIGAGSKFTPMLIGDLLLISGTRGGTFTLVDIDPARLQPMRQLIEKMIKAKEAHHWKVEASVDRGEALRKSHYVICTIEVSGLACVESDHEIPMRYGVKQCVGDTMGPGGLFKGLRTIPVWLDILKDCERYCPDAIVMNYTNPMSMLTLAAGRASSMKCVGLCHSVQSTGRLLAKRAKVPYLETTWECAGINHLAWFTRFEHKGRDLYPALKEQARCDLGNAGDEADDDLVRKDMMLRFGAFITESSGHLSEYLPYYRKRDDLLERYTRTGQMNGETGFYARKWPVARQAADEERERLLKNQGGFDWPRTYEYASWIIEAIEKDSPTIFHGNVVNGGTSGGRLIDNLMGDGAVEVACVASRAGVHPTRYGTLPSAMAAVCDSNMRFFDVATEAALRRDFGLAIQALMLDPLTAAVCSPAEIERMALELRETQDQYLSSYRPC